MPSGTGGSYLFRGFGLARIGTPGERPLDLAANMLCRRLTQRWLAGPRDADVKFLEREAQKLAADQGLEEQALIERLQTILATSLGQPQEAAIARILLMASESVRSNQPQKMLDPIDRAFAARRGPVESSEPAWPPLLLAVRKAAEERGTEVSWAVTDWLVRLVETPGKRFKAAANIAAFLAGELKTLAEKIQGRVKQVMSQRLALRQQIETEKSGTGISLGWLGRAFGGGRPAEDKLTGYCRVWLQEVAEGTALVILDVVNKGLKAFQAELSWRQERVAAFASQFGTVIDNELLSGTPTMSLAGLKGDPDSPTDGTGMQESMPLRMVLRFDPSFQCEVLERRGGLWGVFASDVPRPGIDAGKQPLQSLMEDLQTRPGGGARLQ